MPFGIDPSQVTDAEVVGETSMPPVSVMPPRHGINQVQSAAYLDQNGNLVMPTVAELAVVEKRARAISVFVRVPTFAFVALSGKMPVLVRLAAAGLLVLEAMDLAREQGYDPLEQP